MVFYKDSIFLDSDDSLFFVVNTSIFEKSFDFYSISINLCEKLSSIPFIYCLKFNEFSLENSILIPAT